MELARRGDGAAIRELFSRYWRAARAAAYGVTGEFASAEDAAAEAFRQALVGLDSLRDPDRFGSGYGRSSCAKPGWDFKAVVPRWAL